MIPPRLRTWLSAGVALVLLNSSLTFENVWPTPRIRFTPALSIELAVCVLLLAVLYRRARVLSRRVLPVVWVAVIAGRYLDVTAPGLYGREFNLYWDSQHLGNVTAMLARAVPAWFIAMAVAVLLTAVSVIYLMSYVSFRWLGASMTSPGPRRVMGAAAAVLLLAASAQHVTAWPANLPAFADPVTPAYVRQARFVAGMLGPGSLRPALGVSPDFTGDLGGLKGADVLLVFVESYGAVTYETPAIADGLVASRADLAAAVRETGREVVTAYVESPTFGWDVTV